MTITAENILYHELIGLQAVIEDSSDSSLQGISGKIISETRNMISIEKNGGKTVKIAKTVAKKIKLKIESGVCFISGTSLIGKPEDRLARLH